MSRLKHALVQAVVVIVLGMAVAFIHNAFSVNGINPFRNVAGVPVVTDSTSSEGIRFIDLDEFRNRMENGAVVIDARTAGEYRDGHIPGAVLFDYYEMGKYIEHVVPLLSPVQDILIYCAGPDCEDSELLARELYTMGFKRLMVFGGGYEEWEQAGLAVEGGAM